MPVTWTKLETFTGSRTHSAPDPDNEGETIDTTVDCSDIEVEFTDGTVTHRRMVNVCYNSEGNRHSNRRSRKRCRKQDRCRRNFLRRNKKWQLQKPPLFRG